MKRKAICNFHPPILHKRHQSTTIRFRFMRLSIAKMLPKAAVLRKNVTLVGAKSPLGTDYLAETKNFMLKVL